jgi:hypothetical protein
MNFIGLNHILEQNLQKPQNIQNLKIGLYLLILSIFQNRKKLNDEYLFMEIQCYLIFENIKNNSRNRPNLYFECFDVFAQI